MADQELTQKVENGVDIDHDEAEDRIRLAAYGIWEEEGRPEGRARDHWQEAERRVRAYSERGQSDAPRGTTGADSTARPVESGARGGTAQERAK